MRKWGPYRRSSFGLNPKGDPYGNMYPISWKKMDEASFLEMSADSIMQSIRDSVEESLGRQLPYDWAFPDRPRPPRIGVPTQAQLLDVPPYNSELPAIGEEELAGVHEVMQPPVDELEPDLDAEEQQEMHETMLQLKGLIGEKIAEEDGDPASPPVASDPEA